MSKHDVAFRDQVIEVEKPDPNYREQYNNEMSAMIAQKLTQAKKLHLVAELILSMSLAVLFGSLAIFAPKGLPWFGRIGFGVGAVSGLAFVGLCVGVLKKGNLNLKKDGLAAASLGWGVVIVTGTIALAFANKLPDPVVGLQWLVGVLFFLIGAGVLLLCAHIQRSEMNTREKLLEIEYRLGELAERMTGQPRQ
jgi:hypothetical protein